MNRSWYYTYTTKQAQRVHTRIALKTLPCFRLFTMPRTSYSCTAYFSLPPVSCLLLRPIPHPAEGSQERLGGAVVGYKALLLICWVTLSLGSHSSTGSVVFPINTNQCLPHWLDKKFVGCTTAAGAVVNLSLSPSQFTLCERGWKEDL